MGVQTMPMDYGQSLQVNNQGQGQSPLMSEAPLKVIDLVLDY